MRDVLGENRELLWVELSGGPALSERIVTRSQVAKGKALNGLATGAAGCAVANYFDGQMSNPTGEADVVLSFPKE